VSPDARLIRQLDWGSCLATLALCLIGVAFINSARSTDGQMSEEALRQLVALGLGLIVAVVILRVDYHRLVKLAPWAYGACILLLLATFAFGTSVGGNKAWLRLGSISLQPAEPMKVATLLMVASIAAKREARVRLLDVAAVSGIVLVPFALVVVQDMGTALTFLPLLVAVVFVSGLRWRWVVAAILAAALCAPFAWSHLKPYQRERVKVVLDPTRDPAGKGYHSIQSMIAVGSGGILGQGYGHGPQNRLGFLPERHTDFIFAIIAEEGGFLGALAVLGLYMFLVARLAESAIQARDRLGALICVGVMVFIGIHLVVNVGMSLGALPVIGITLPFVSYGGSSILAFMAMMALALNVRMRRLGR
jgi:rod shape determining protein RodA